MSSLEWLALLDQGVITPLVNWLPHSCIAMNDGCIQVESRHYKCIKCICESTHTASFYTIIYRGVEILIVSNP